jgi:hypothetical protein
MHNLYATGLAEPPTDRACEAEEQQARNPGLTVPSVAATCPACDSHNVSDPTGLGRCGDCGMTDNLSAFMGGGMTANAVITPSKFGKGGDHTSARKVRAYTISGGVD